MDGFEFRDRLGCVSQACGAGVVTRVATNAYGEYGDPDDIAPSISAAQVITLEEQLATTSLRSLLSECLPRSSLS
jgi:hypothetical protein